MVDTSNDLAEMLLERSSSQYAAFSDALSALLDSYDPAFDAVRGQTGGTHPAVVCSALILVGNLSFHEASRASLMSDQGLITLIQKVVDSSSAGAGGVDCCYRPPARWRPWMGEPGDDEAFSIMDSGSLRDVASAARRALAILGVDDSHQKGLTAPEGGGGARRGLRVLSIDGGGVKGVASIRMLAEVERR